MVITSPAAILLQMLTERMVDVIAEWLLLW